MNDKFIQEFKEIILDFFNDNVIKCIINSIKTIITNNYKKL